MIVGSKRRIDASPPPDPGLVPRNVQEEEWQLRQATEASLARIACPVCQRSYAQADIDRHVNACLDQPGPVAGSTSTQKEDKCTSSPSLTQSHAAVSSEWAALLPGPQDKPASQTKRAPFYKILEGMPLSVDAFRYGSIEGCEGYFLTHFHSDHYAGLSSRWKHGLIYCSEETARLVTKRLKVDPAWLRPLPMNEPQLIPRSGGVYVTCLDANHCPGACLFLFEGPQTVFLHQNAAFHRTASNRVVRYLHCGDFRACPAHTSHPALQKPVDIVYLDTTYLHPKYNFPAQPQVVQACAAMLMQSTPRKTLSDFWQRRSDPEPLEQLVLVGTYSLGKERLVKQLAQTLNTSIFCAHVTRHETLLELDDPELHAMLTRKPLEARVHVVSLHWISYESVAAYVQALQRQGMRITITTAFRPTGWTFQRTTAPAPTPSRHVEALLKASQPPEFTTSNLVCAPASTPSLRLVNVPYSEHSSFYELMVFLLTLHPLRVIPTVNVGSAPGRTRMKAWLDVCSHASQAQRSVKPRCSDYW